MESKLAGRRFLPQHFILNPAYPNSALGFYWLQRIFGAGYFRGGIFSVADTFVHNVSALNRLLEITAPLYRSIATASRTGYLAPASGLRSYPNLGADPFLQGLNM